MSKKKKQETGGLQAPKMSVVEKEEIKAEKAKAERARKKEKAKAERAERPGLFRRMWRGIRNTAAELRKVNWPTLAQTVSKTGVVMAVVLVFSIVIFPICVFINFFYIFWYIGIIFVLYITYNLF